MCFSATASFVSAAVLIPVGIYGISQALEKNRSYLALAAFPLLFGLQQLVEGFLWLNMAGEEVSFHWMAMGFLFFAYFLWPFYVPFSAHLIEKEAGRRSIFKAFTFVGFVFGAALYVPLLFTPDWLLVELAKNSILYKPVLIFDEVVSRTVVRVFYAIIIAIPLLFSSVRTLKVFGILIFSSVVFSAIYYNYAFVSIWCFFAAILSLYIAYIMYQLPPKNA